MSTARPGHNVTRLRSVPYDTYVHLRKARGNRRLRMAYHDGLLELTSLESRYENEKGARLLAHGVRAYCNAFDVAYEEAGSTTFHKGVPGRKKGDGKEPDESFYLREAAEAIVGKNSLDLTADPPPSLWIEVDNRGSSRTKLPLYAGLGIPEVWRYRARARSLWFGRLAGDGYDEIATSIALPGLTPAMVLGLLDESWSQVMSAWDRWLERVWFPEHRQELIDRAAGRSEEV
jgi:Uma2 family endonuclease